MAKNSPPKGPAAPQKPGFGSQAPFRPTVGLPAGAAGGRATVQMPGGAGGFRAGAPGPGGPGPDDIVRVLKLGGAHLAAGRLDHAGSAAGAVLKLQPENPDALHLLGLVALGKGSPDKAEQLIAAAAARMPRHVNVWVNLGNAQRDQGKVDEALLSYQRAEAMNREYPDVYLERGQLYQHSAQYPEALADFRRLIELAPGDAASYMRAASAATDAGLFREALAFCQQAMERLEPVPVQVKAILATTYERLGDLPKALEWAEAALAENPQSASALRTWSKAQRRLRKGDKALLDMLRRRLENVDFDSLSTPEARLLFSELAQLCDEQNDVGPAFSYFTRMNERTLALPELKFADRRKFIGEVEHLSRLLDKNFTSSWSALPDIEIEPGHAAPPVFLVGFPRSGTTLLDQILDAHPGVQVFEEYPFIGRIKNSLAGYPEMLATLTEEQRQAARQRYWSELRKEGARFEDRLIVDKMPLSLVHSGLIHRLFPEAKFIFAIRHPADCVLSCFMQDFVPNASMQNFLTLDGSAALYDRVMTLWQKYREALPLRIHEVRYEHLISDLRAEVEPVLAFLGLGWDEAVSDPAAHALSRGTIRTPSYSQVTQPIYSNAAERWRRYEEQMKPVLPVLKPHVERLGYSL